MKKQFRRIILLISFPCIVVVSVFLIYLFYSKTEYIGTVTYLGIAITVILAVMLIILIAANFAAKKLTDKFIGSLENIGLDSPNITDYDELMQFIVNIKDQKRTYRKRIEELSKRADTIETIMNSMQEGLILIDEDSFILSANNSAHRVFGVNIEKRNLMHIYRESNFQNALEKCLDGENTELQMERGDKIYTVYFSPVFSKTYPRGSRSARGAVILIHDATESQMAEKQRREFSANVSHELKTPLTTISALAEMIAQGIAKEEDIKGFADRINEQSGRLLVLIDDIIRISEFDEGKANVEASVFDLWELAESVAESLRENKNNVEIDITGERFDISANYRMIDELLYNLIDNGIKYNKENGKVTIELTQVEEKLCKISVADTGIGIGNEHHPHVFERFYRADKSRSKKTGGTGLGLSIVKHITEYYNGKVELESTPNIGTTVTCYLRYR